MREQICHCVQTMAIGHNQASHAKVKMCYKTFARKMNEKRLFLYMTLILFHTLNLSDNVSASLYRGHQSRSSSIPFPPQHQLFPPQHHLLSLSSALSSTDPFIFCLLLCSCLNQFNLYFLCLQNFQPVLLTCSFLTLSIYLNTFSSSIFAFPSWLLDRTILLLSPSNIL